MFYREENLVELTENQADNFVELMQNKKIAILGGNPNWVSKIKQVFPNARYVAGNANNADLSFVNKMDYVFFNRTHGNHPFYWTLCNFMERNDVPFHMLNHSGSINRTISEMKDCVKI